MNSRILARAASVIGRPSTVGYTLSLIEFGFFVILSFLTWNTPGRLSGVPFLIASGATFTLTLLYFKRDFRHT